MNEPSMTREECEAIVEEIKTCLDCRYCARIAYSDATTPGFHYTECTHHRVIVRIARAHLELLDECDSLRRGWQPIEKAPKNGTKVLVFGDAEGAERCSFLARWKPDYLGGKEYWHWGAPGFVGCVKATHWMPLPSPPDAAISENAANEGGRE